MKKSFEKICLILPEKFLMSEVVFSVIINRDRDFIYEQIFLIFHQTVVKSNKIPVILNLQFLIIFLNIIVKS